MVVGSSGAVWRSPPARSWAAASMLRSSVNWIVMLLTPSALTDVIESMPAIVENWRFEWGGHGGRHRLGARARQARAHLDGRKVDVRQVVSPALLVRHHAEQNGGPPSAAW